MTATGALCGLVVCAGVMPQHAPRAVSDTPAASPPAADSVVMERLPGSFGPWPGYRVRLAPSGDVHLELRPAGDSVRSVRTSVTPEVALDLLERAAALGLDHLPGQLMGREPFCPVVATDQASIIITLHRPEGPERIEDNLGCRETGDESDEGVIGRLRGFEAAMHDRLGLRRWVEQGSRFRDDIVTTRAGRIPDPRPLSELVEGPVFTPYTRMPTILNRDVVRRASEREYPERLREAGVGGRARVFFLLADDGTVVKRVLHETSGNPELDAAALRVAEVFRFSPAMNRDRRVPVWISLPIRFGAGGA